MHLNPSSLITRKFTKTSEPLQSTFLLVASVLCAVTLTFAGTASAGPEGWSGKDKTVTPIMEEPFSWTGFYFGGHLGGASNDYAFGPHDTDYFVSDELETVVFTGGSTPTIFTFSHPGQDGGANGSIIGGGQLGYQHQFGHFVAGIEGDFGSMDNKSDTVRFASQQFANNLDPFGDDAQVTLTTTRQAQTEWAGSARLKAGYATGRLLLYATGGVSFVDVKVTSVDASNASFFLSGIGTTNTAFVFRSHEEEVLAGWTAGGGLEWAMTNLVSIGLEYRHNDWGDKNFNSHALFPLGSSTTNIDVSGDQVTFRVNLLLGHLRH